MPIYEYRCKQCDNVFEVLTLSSSSEEKPICTKCDSNDVSKLMSAGSIRSGADSLQSVPTMPSAGCGGGSGFS